MSRDKGGAMGGFWSKSTRNFTVFFGILRKWLSGNGRWRVFLKFGMEIVKKMSNFEVTMD
jgi:hypothetical protein